MDAAASLTPDWEKVQGKKLPDIAFVDASGNGGRLSDFRSRVLILHPMFTHCPSTCSIVSKQIAMALSELKESQRKKVRILSFSFDPDETNEGLIRFEKLLHSDPVMWRVVRANPDQIRELLNALDFKTMQIAKSNFEHANLVFVVNGDGVLRDYIFGSDLTAERLTQSLKDASAGRLVSKSFVLVFGIVGLLIMTFVTVYLWSRQTA